MINPPKMGLELCSSCHFFKNRIDVEQDGTSINSANTWMFSHLVWLGLKWAPTVGGLDVNTQFRHHQAVVEWPLGNAKLSICPLCKCSLTCNKVSVAVVAETDPWCAKRD
jgi:hypothetical protein